MYEFKKGEIIYYFIKYKNSSVPGVVKLESEKDQSSEHGISLIFIIKKIFTKQYVGSENRIIAGHSISANELQGVGASGIGTYFYKPKALIQNMFEVC
jgi:hypothetical protein